MKKNTGVGHAIKVNRNNERKESDKSVKRGKANSKETRKYRWRTKFLPALSWELNIEGVRKVEIRFRELLTSAR